ncbi:hypothetical protein [Fodinibius sediminis]|uniref:EamA-like transporter family protein n=1 Tax=Fodinibius sediminis TaxID=1214077 RepID=A0A521DDQ4_9BACT|nr:hypothetical protein [Fodinibius sediminis]SMO69281.1 hypothetical protein SAMN06265218_109180 [Fodinibius sediminis]
MVLLYLLLSSACSLGVAHLLKRSEAEGLRTLNTLTVNYASASVFAFLVGFSESNGPINWLPDQYVLFFCGIIGLFFISNFIAYSKSVHANGIGVTIAAMRLSLLIPVLLSIMVYDETMSGTKISGVVLVFGALFLLVPHTKTIRIGNFYASWLLPTVFILTGLADSSLKIYNEELSTVFSETIFMAWVFLCAFIIGLVVVLMRKGTLVSRDEVKMGMLIGLPNLYSAVFLMYALDGMAGAIAFPVVNVINVLGGTFLGLFLWNDRVSVKQWSGICVALVAIWILI